MEYRTERYEATVDVASYVRECVDVEEFLGYCRQCPNYGQLWSCPEFDFDPYEYWNRYETLRVIGVKILLPEDLAGKTCEPSEVRRVMEEALGTEKKKLAQELFALEEQIPGSVSLSAGSCQECAPGQCARREGKPCRHQERLRYSIEALGGNVGLTVTRFLKQQLEWMEEGRMPRYFILVGGLLTGARI